MTQFSHFRVHRTSVDTAAHLPFKSEKRSFSNLAPFHVCCPHTKQALCRCKIHGPEDHKFIMAAKLAYQAFTLRFPEYEQEFGPAKLVKRFELPPSLVDLAEEEDKAVKQRQSAEAGAEEDSSRLAEEKTRSTSRKTSEPHTTRGVLDRLARKHNIESFTEAAETAPHLHPYPFPAQDESRRTNAGRRLSAAKNKRKRKVDDKSCYECGAASSPETMLICVNCGDRVHDSCHDPILTHIPQELRSTWLCQDCKLCEECSDPGDESKLLLCEGCDRGFHIYCLNPPLERIPKGRWLCETCTARRSALSGGGSKKRLRAEESDTESGTPSAKRRRTGESDTEAEGSGNRVLLRRSSRLVK